MKRYNPLEIEPKWQQFWDDNGTYVTNLGSDKTKYYSMSMFNYPSGAGIHIGHAMNYTISDVMARFKRQQGYESYHPVGWDSFGLPAENYAIKTGVSPQQSMAKIIPEYHKQYRAMGWSNDWTKEIITSDPEYYKWTQWIFAQMFKKGLAYQDARLQWWCDIDKTVLSNEQVIDGKCWRHDGPDDPLVTQREIKQWFLKITDYAEQLLDATDALDWTESVKLAQKNWIGKSQGAEIEFRVSNLESRDSLKFTPKLTEMVVSGEKTSTFRLDQKNLAIDDIAEFLTREGSTVTPFGYARITQIRQMKLGDIPNDFEGHEAFDSDEQKLAKYREYYGDKVTLDSEITIYNFEYLPNLKLENQNSITVFTTRPDTIFGATFLVVAPEHPQLDQLVTDDQKTIVDEYVASAAKKSELERMETKEKTGVFTGSYVANPVNGEKIPVWVADYVLYGYGTGAIMAVPAHDERDQEFAEKFDLPIVHVLDDNESMINSAQFDGLNVSDAREQIVAWLEQQGIGTSKTTFKIRDWSVSRQRYWGAPIPIIHCPTDGAVLVPDDQLPVVLPELDDFSPTGDGRSALARATDWLHVACPVCGGDAERETDTLDTYMCSSWYFLRYLDPHNADVAFTSDVANRWMPVDFYNGGDHATAHMIYARFVTRFLHDLGMVGDPEPFKRFLFNGKITAADGSAFSKSKGNGIDPLEIINSGYGADALRTYLMFAAPLDFGAKWDPNGVPGTYRFLNRIWNLVQELNEQKPDAARDVELHCHAVHRTIKKVTHDLLDQKYNTAISAIMECVNDLYKAKAEKGFAADDWHPALSAIVALIAPFAPYVSEELWHQLGHNTSVHHDSWPQWDDKYLVTDTVTIIVQVNGKLRAKLQVAKDSTREEIEKVALENENVHAFTSGKQPKKIIYVAGKLVNLVV